MMPRICQTRSLSIICCCMITLVLGTSYDYGLDVTKALKARRQTGNVTITTGMPRNPDGSVPVRREIRQLQQDTNSWDLYILALDMMQYTDQSDPTSWFSITSIHGVPFQSWSGVSPTQGNEKSGYCHHEDILFPTWHRAYVALYEQELCGRAQFIASLYSKDVRYVFEAAAADCRAPYLDWAAVPPDGANMLPASVGGSPQINISGPAGTQTIANPLFTYEFKPPDPSIFFNITPWANWDSTRRAPPDDSADSPSNNSAVNQNLMGHMIQNQQRLYNLFSNYDNYTIFSNEGWAADTSQYDSLESLHDNIHAMLGGLDGHMTIVPFSAFDPVFFLHHCMIDRLYAMWQVMYPDSWVAPEVARYNSYTTSVGQVLDALSPLTPFYASSNGTFWNSDMLRDITVLGYTYPEMARISLSNQTSVLAGRASVASAINQLYGSYSVNSLSLNKKRSEHAQTHGPHQTKGYSAVAGSARELDASLLVNRIISQDGQYREWIANVRINRQGLDGPYSVKLFFDDVIGTCIGTVGVFAYPPEVANLMQMAPSAQYISSTVPLTKALVDKVTDETIASMEPEDVGGFLAERLQVSVTRSDGTEVNPHNVPGLRIQIISALVQATSSENHLPSWEEPDFELDFM